ncbi:MAG: PAS domain S-box protein [Bacteroidia bacterium]|nr:PAS domain S-box protein [Bacteroidia bacterium]
MKSRKVLVVEDDKMLATVFSMFLKELGHDLIGFYTNAEKAIEKCDEKLPDVILMDIHLPGETDGIKATEIIQEKYDIPVIYITGDTQKETVKRASYTKSYGYLIKPIDKTELGINIELACVKHQFDKELRIRERRYRTLLDVSSNAILLIVNGVIEYVSLAGLKLFGTIYIEDVIEKSFISFIPSDFHKVIQQEFNDLLYGKNDKIEYSPFEILALNGKLHSVSLAGSLVEFKNERAIQLVICDFTENIEVKKVLDIQNNIINNVNIGISTLNLNGIVTSWNRGAEMIFGISQKEAVGKKISKFFINTDDKEFHAKAIESTLKAQLYEENFKIIDKKTNSEKYLELSFSVIKNQGNQPSGIVCVIRDITEQQTKSEEFLFSKVNFNAVFNGSTEAIFIIDSDFNIVDLNKLAKQYSRKFFLKEMVSGDHLSDILSFFDRDEFTNLFENTFDGISHFLDRAIVLHDKQYFFRINIYPVTDESDDDINRCCISFLDITDKKLAEKELAETHAELKPLFDSSIQRFFLVDSDCKVVTFNKAAFEIIKKEFKRNLARGDSLLDFISPEIGVEEFKKKFEAAKEGKHGTFKIKLNYEGEVYWEEVHLDPIKDEVGETKRILYWTLDVTEQEENLAALKKSEERYSLIASGGNDGLWDWDMVNNQLYVSPRWKVVLGYDIDEYISRQDVKEKLIHPDDISSVRENLQKYIKGETKNYFNEYRIRHKSGEYHWIMERGIVLRGEGGKPCRFAGSITDITDRKKAEQELKAANEALLEERSMFIKGNVVVFRVDAFKFTNVEYVSENVGEVLGYSAQEFYSGAIDFTTLIHKDDYEMHDNERKQAFDKGKNHIDFSNYRLVRKDSGVIWVKDSTSILWDKQGNIKTLLGYIVDITKEMKAELGKELVEQSLKESEQTNKVLLEAIPDLIFVVDKDGNYLDYRSDKKSGLSVPDSDVIGKKCNDFFSGAKLDEMLEKIKHAIITNEVQTIEYDISSPKGIRWFEARITAFSENKVIHSAAKAANKESHRLHRFSK